MGLWLFGWVEVEGRRKNGGRGCMVYVSNVQSVLARLWMRSGRVCASSLYTVHDEAMMLLPPSLAQLWT